MAVFYRWDSTASRLEVPTSEHVPTFEHGLLDWESSALTTRPLLHKKYIKKKLNFEIGFRFK